MIECLMGLIVFPSVVKGKFYGDMLPGLSYGAFGKKGIVDFLKIICFDSFWAFVRRTISWWCTNYTISFLCNYSLFMFFLTIGRLFFISAF